LDTYTTALFILGALLFVQELRNRRIEGGGNGCGGSSLSKWIKRYGREDILPKRVKVETMNEIDELKAARKRIRELEAALADAHMDYCLESAFLDIACGRLGTSTEELKKKNVITLAEGRKKRGIA
jgi:hypothetical protein